MGNYKLAKTKFSWKDKFHRKIWMTLGNNLKIVLRQQMQKHEDSARARK